MASYIWKRKRYNNRSDWMRARWADKETAEKLSNAISESMIGKNTGPNPKLSAARKRNWKDPKYREKMVRKRKEVANRPGFQEKRIASLEKFYEGSPSARKEKSKASKKMWKEMSKATKKRRAKKLSIATSKQNKRQWADPVWAAEMTRVRQEQGRNPENIKTFEKASREKWRDPVYRRKQMKSRKNSYKYNVIRHKKTSEALKGHPSWNAGQTKETHPTLAKFSKRLTGKIPEYGKWLYLYDGKKKIWMRSTWEVAYAVWADGQKIKWEYEPRWFNIGKGSWVGVSYTPDFYHPKTKEWVEVKGRYSGENKRKIAAFRKQYPKLKLVVLEYKELTAMGVMKVQRKLKIKKQRNPRKRWHEPVPAQIHPRK